MHLAGQLGEYQQVTETAISEDVERWFARIQLMGRIFTRTYLNLDP